MNNDARQCGGLIRVCLHDEQDGRLTSRARETITVSRRPATVVTANGIVRTTEQAREHVQDVDTLVTVQLLKDS